VINQKRRVTIPSKAASEAGLQDGDCVSVRASGFGRLVIERVELPPGAAPAQPELTTPAEPAPGEAA
jgi:bifunctional DNA-binding transcriptional regulator/antitoxin component of YhaV-PrlF toxin-antitoxin module